MTPLLPRLTGDERREMLALVWSLNEASPSAAYVARLEELTCGHADGPSLYVRAADLLSNLHWCFAVEADVVDELTEFIIADDAHASAIQAERRQIVEQLRVQQRAEVPSRIGKSKGTINVPKKPLVALGRSLPEFRSMRTSAALWTAAVVTNCLLICLLAVAVAPRFRERANEPAALNFEKTPSRPNSVSPSNDDVHRDVAGDAKYVARLVRAVNCKWRDGKSRHAGQWMYSGDMPLRSGYVELEFVNGTVIKFAGPIKLGLQSVSRTKLDRGRLTAVVPKQAIGFTVATPTTDVVDLGTEFGVDVDEHGNSEVSVFQGSVEIASPRMGRQTLVAGQGRRIAAVGVTAIPVRRENFLADHPPALREGEVEAVNQHIDSHWSMPECWSDKHLPAAGVDYHIGRSEATRLRTPQTLNPDPFGGRSLTVHSGSILVLKHFGLVGIEDLRLAGGELYVWEPRATETEIGLSGKLRVDKPSSITLRGCVLRLDSSLEGSGLLSVIGPGKLLLANSNAECKIDLRIENAHLIPTESCSFGQGRVLLATGCLEVRQPLSFPKASLELASGASVALASSLTVLSTRVNGQQLTAGTYPVAELTKQFPGYFTGSGGVMTVASPVAAAD